MKPTFYEIIISQSSVYHMLLYNMPCIPCLRILTKNEVTFRTKLYYTPAMNGLLKLEEKHFSKEL